MATLREMFGPHKPCKTFEGAYNRVLKAVKELDDAGHTDTINYTIGVTTEGLFYPIVTIQVNSGHFTQLLHFFTNRNICVTGY